MLREMEFKIVDTMGCQNREDAKESFCRQLEYLCEDGWEIVSIKFGNSSSGTLFQALVKRDLSAPDLGID